MRREMCPPVDPESLPSLLALFCPSILAQFLYRGQLKLPCGLLLNKEKLHLHLQQLHHATRGQKHHWEPLKNKTADILHLSYCQQIL